MIETRPGCAKQQIEAFNNLRPIVLREEGCLQYELNRVIDDENKYILIEKWASIEALKAHDIAPHMIAADAKNIAFRAGPAKVFQVQAI